MLVDFRQGAAFQEGESMEGFGEGRGRETPFPVGKGVHFLSSPRISAAVKLAEQPVIPGCRAGVH